ncbi:ABC transporter permease [Dermacoccaceae bacterium W4C1]
MLTVALSQVRHGVRRWLAPGIAIILGVAFVAATLSLRAGMNQALADSVAASVQGSSAVLTAGDAPLTPQRVDQIAATPGVSGVRPEITAGVSLTHAGRTETALGNATSPSALTEVKGAARVTSDSIIINPDAAERLDAAVGSTITVTDEAGAAHRVRVNGIADVPGLSGMPAIVAPAEQLRTWSGEPGFESILVSGGGQQEVAQALRRISGPGEVVRTADQEIELRVSQQVTGIQAMTTFFGIFAIIAVFVSALVIANTFQILLAQRARQVALLRCVGASRRQVRRSVLIESIVLGAGSSLLGLAVGVGLVAAFQRFFGDLLPIPMGSTVLTPASVIVPVLLGLSVTVLAARRPARRASSVPPLAALNDNGLETTETRSVRGRVTAGAVISAIGFALLLIGAAKGSAMSAVAGGLISFVGVVMLTPYLVPLASRGLGKVFGFAGVPAELATDNTVRNPRRAAATSTALLVGITLMVSMLVGAATGQRAINDSVDERFSLDLSVSAEHGAIPAAAQERIAAVDGVATSAALRAGQVTVGRAGQQWQQTVMAAPPSSAKVLRDSSGLNGLRPGVVLINREMARTSGITAGERVRVGGASLTAVVNPQVVGDGVVISDNDLERVAPSLPVSSMWLRLQDGADPSRVIGEVRTAAAGTAVLLDGAAGARQQVDQSVRLMLLLTGALLAVAVLIALVGVANTLSLSVLERRRETALLRALGLTRSQVRRTVAVESVLVALVAAVLGTALGVLYGWAGTRALLGTFAEGVLPQVPFIAVLAVLLAAAASGLGAAVLPARRAARTAPVQALAAD